jgi:hypothetical protein
MDIAVIVKFLAPCMPFLLTMGNKAAEGASQKVGEDVWNRAKAIWDKLWPKVEAKEAAKEAAEDVANWEHLKFVRTDELADRGENQRK